MRTDSGSPLPTLASYIVRGRLATGGVGELLLASPLENPSARVVLKRALPHLAHEVEVREGLLSEARWTRTVQSPHVVRLLEVLAPQGELVLVLEYIHGVSLAYLLEAEAHRGEPIPVGVKLRILLDALAGLAALHETSVEGRVLLHGDLTPSNIVVGLDGVTRLCDLGLAIPERTGGTAEFRGTAAYTAPEVWQRIEQTRRSDVFSAGIVLWETLRGERLFRGDGFLATLQNVLEAPIPPLDQGRPELAPWAPTVHAALQRDVSRRPPFARALLDLLQTVGGAAPGEEVSHVVKEWAGEILRKRWRE
ncbi:MAG: serine/threonine-protein kinase [Myxococcales bacterium]|nr:serine/threonine protein kinase [Polyangiaceae bacterium]MDW8248754.1 serine/threonine-protein kinase [Myxococcales bacterium]